MAGKTLPDLPLAGALTGAEPVYVVQTDDRRTTTGDIANLLLPQVQTAQATAVAATTTANAAQSTASGAATTASTAATTATAALPKAGGVMTGSITLQADPTAPLHPASKQYVDTGLSRIKKLQNLVALNCQNPLANGTVTDTTNNSLNMRRPVTLPTGCDWTDIVVAIPGSYHRPLETDLPTPLSVRAQLEAPTGVFTELFTRDGGKFLSVPVGRTMPRFEPARLHLDAGSLIAPKLWVNWTPGSLPLKTNEQWEITGSWTALGTDVADHTGDTTVFTSAAATQLFGGVQLYARPSAPIACVGFLGDSITAAGLDQADPVTGAISYEKALRNVIPCINVGMGGDSCVSYLARHNVRDQFLIDPLTGSPTITHIVIAFGRNEMAGAGAATTFIANLQLIIKMWLARGVAVSLISITPHTTSSNNYTDLAGQTVTDATEEANRLTANAFFRANYQWLGVSNFFDAGRVADPNDIGKWACPDGAPGYWGLMVPTMAGRGIASVARAAYPNHAATGQFFPANTTVNCQVYPYPGDTGTGGGQVRLTFTVQGWVPTTATVVAAGDYDFPPMIVVPGSLCGDGLHPSIRGYQEFIHQSGMSPASFPLQ